MSQLEINTPTSKIRALFNKGVQSGAYQLPEVKLFLEEVDRIDSAFEELGRNQKEIEASPKPLAKKIND